MKYLDENGVQYLWNKAKQKFVAVEAGKGLSANDYTTAEKNKLDGIQAEATKTEVTKILQSGTKVATIIVNGVPTDIYCEKNTDTHYTAKNVVAGTATGVTDTQVELDNGNVYLNTVENGQVTSSKKISGTGAIEVKSDTAGNITINAEVESLADATTTKSGLMSAADKTKLNGISTGAQVNVIESVKVNGTAQTVTSKAVNITVPTKVSDLNNDSKYQTEEQVTQKITDAVSGITSLDYQIVETLPATGEKGIIYLVKDGDSESPNAYVEYIYINNNFEILGRKELDISNCVNRSELVAITNAEIDAICV